MRFHYKLSWVFLNLIAKLLFGFRVVGRELVPKEGPVIIASNHISYCDPPIVGSGVPREVFFLAKEELFRNRFFAWLIKKYNAIPLRRAVGDLGAVKKAVELLNQGKAVLMFPEGTRSLSGKLLKPKAGVGMIATLTSAPIVPVYVFGTNRLLDALLRKSRIEVRFGSPIYPEAMEPDASSRHRYVLLSQEVMAQIAKLAEASKKES